MTLRLQIKVHRLSNPDGKSDFRSEISFSKGQHGVCEINSLKDELSTASSPEAGEIDFKTAASAVRNHEIPDDLDDLTLEELAQLPDGHNNPAITALQSLVRGLLISETVTLRQQFSVSLPTLGVTTLIPDCSPASEDQEGCHTVALEIIVLRELSLLGLGPLLKELGDIFIHQPESDSELPILFYWLAFQVNHNPETHDILSRLLVNRLFSRGLAIDPSGRLVDPEELCTMIYMTRTAVERWGREHGDILGFLTERLVLLIGKFGCTLTLENGVRWCQEAFALYPTTDHAEVEIFGRLLFTRFQRLKREEDLEEALVWGRRALDVCPADNEQARVHDLYALGERLFAKHRTFGNVGDSDLDETIQMWRAAYELESNGKGGSGCPAFVSLHQLATATHARYIERRQQADINECIKLGRRLLEFFPPGHKHRDEAISMLCEFLVEHIHDPKYMEEIVDLLHQKQYPRDHADVEPHCRSLCKSAGIMMYCGYLSSKVEYVDEAIRLFQQAFSITVTNEGKCGASTGLGYAHLVRLWAKRSASDATAALEHLTKAYNEWDSHTALMGLVEFYADEENQHYDPQRAIGLLETCLEREDMGAGQRLEFVTRIITSYPDIAIDTKFSKQLQVILLKTIRLMPRAAYFGLHVKSRLRTLRQWPSWVNLLATLLCSNHKPVQAIEMLEEARAVFWSQGQQLRMDFEQHPSPPPSYPEKYHNVHHRVPQLPQEFRQRLYRIAQELESASFAPELGMTGIMPMIEDEELVRRRRLNAEYNDVIEQVRKLPGFECFMLPEPICLLAEAAAKGPVVILVSFGEAYAIIIEYPDTHLK
ncbi:hypothetical protein PHLCEN_2v6190 [Hermanssonia centrifuga]|uniref:Uncharacterized protein n=1 Tax=Hermanssonia centrifuga TaxID=98765 RepID=A0A2R6P085_9APHY|nr:hypothetical protein PHLCEN_2v6190 [Hermanssonia centrifuga]